MYMAAVPMLWCNEVPHEKGTSYHNALPFHFAGPAHACHHHQPLDSLLHQRLPSWAVLYPSWAVFQGSSPSVMSHNVWTSVCASSHATPSNSRHKVSCHWAQSWLLRLKHHQQRNPRMALSCCRIACKVWHKLTWPFAGEFSLDALSSRGRLAAATSLFFLPCNIAHGHCPVWNINSNVAREQRWWACATAWVRPTLHKTP